MGKVVWSLVVKKSLILLFALVAMLAGGFVYQWAKWDFETLAGERMKWQNLEGQWVVVNFFAEWCAPCLKEIPELNAFARFADTQNDLSMFAVSYDLLNDQELLEVKQKYDIEFSLIKPQMQASPFERPAALPVTYILDPEGNLRKRLMGEQTDESLQQVIGALKRL